jgi:hypothetical protein
MRTEELCNFKFSKNPTGNDRGVSFLIIIEGTHSSSHGAPELLSRPLCVSKNEVKIFFLLSYQLIAGQGHLILKVYRSHRRHTTVSRTPLDERLTRRRDLYLKTHNTKNRRASMSPAEFEPVIPASERPQTLALDRTVTVIGEFKH